MTIQPLKPIETDEAQEIALWRASAALLAAARDQWEIEKAERDEWCYAADGHRSVDAGMFARLSVSLPCLDGEILEYITDEEDRDAGLAFLMEPLGPWWEFYDTEDDPGHFTIVAEYVG